MDQVRQQSARVNLESAFSTAENHLGIARLLDPEGTCDVVIVLKFENNDCFVLSF